MHVSVSSIPSVDYDAARQEMSAVYITLEACLRSHKNLMSSPLDQVHSVCLADEIDTRPERNVHVMMGGRSVEACQSRRRDFALSVGVSTLAHASRSANFERSFVLWGMASLHTQRAAFAQNQ